jgi:hypothetical protein
MTYKGENTMNKRSTLVMIGAVLMSLGLMCEAVTAQPPVKDGPTMTGQVTQVILYQGQALITRTIPLEGLQGANEIIISGLPEQVVQDSVFAEGSDGVEIRAVRFRSRAVGEEPREEVRKLDEALEKASDTLQANQRLTQNLTKQGQFLDQMDNFVAPTAKADLARGVLDAIGLERIAQFSFGQRDVAAKSTAELEKANREVTRQVTLLTRKREELTRGSQKAVREALLFVEKKGAAKDTLRLNYLVGSCGWSPTYTFRATDDRKTVAMECNALIHQMTGEDWSNVQLTLSTASPGLSAAGPGLAAFPISLVPAGQTARLNSRDVEEQVKGIKQRQYDANEANRKAIKLSESLGSSFAANTAAGEFQSLELGVGKDVLASVVSIRDQVGPSLSYQLANPVSLASRSDQQMVRILKTQFKSSFYYVATPVLTSQVYREAELVNQSADDLLAGPIAVYLEGRFVGRSEIPTVARGQTFVVGFGADPQLRARRELVQRTEAVQGGNRELSFKYRLAVENYKEQPVPVRLFDRMPYSERDNEIRVKLGELKETLSTDALYQRIEKPKNILRWDITVPARATADKTHLLEYSFTVEFDRNLTVNLPGVTPPQAPGQSAPPAPAAAQPKAQQEFEQMQKSRFAR